MRLRYAFLCSVLVGCGSTVPSGQDSSSTTESSASDTTLSSSGPTCPVGANGCPCTNGGSCDGGLECNDGVCVPPGGSATEASTTTPADSSDTSPADSSGTSMTDPTSASSSETGMPAELDDWTKRRPVLVSNPNDTAMMDHQVMIDVDWDEDFAADLSDLRFTDESGTQILPHWVESSTAPVIARIWVRVPDVPADDAATIYLWYGNPMATAEEHPEQVFDHWEDFEGTDLPIGWSASDVYEVSSGRLSMTVGSVYTDVPLVTMPGLLVEVRARIPNEDPSIWAGTLSIAATQGDVGDQDAMHMSLSPLGMSASQGNVGVVSEYWNNAPGAAASQFDWYALGMGDGVIRFGKTHDYGRNIVYWHDYEYDLPNDYYVWLGGPYGSTSGSDDVQDMDVDILLVRKFSLLPAETFAGGEEDV
jgi:hypothetical protein